MAGQWKRLGDEAARIWRAVGACALGCFLVIATVAPNPPTPVGAMPHEDSSAASISFASFVPSEEGPADLSSYALACHMHFEHHQLVSVENGFLTPAREPVRTSHLMRINPLTSRALSPPEKPPRA